MTTTLQQLDDKVQKLEVSGSLAIPPSGLTTSVYCWSANIVCMFQGAVIQGQLHHFIHDPNEDDQGQPRVLHHSEGGGLWKYGSLAVCAQHFRVRQVSKHNLH